MISGQEQTYKEFKNRFKGMRDGQLMGAYLSDFGNPGWVGARGAFYAALREEFENRGYDYSDLVDKLIFLLKNKNKRIRKGVKI